MCSNLPDWNKVIKVYDSRNEAYRAAGIAEVNQPEKEVTKKCIAGFLHWAGSGWWTSLSVPEMPTKAINRNMQGRCVVGPVKRFGQLWQKTYRLTIDKPV